MLKCLKPAMRGPCHDDESLALRTLCRGRAAAGSPDKGSFTSGVWHGKANYDGDGKFSDCTMTAQSKSGVLLGFVISKDFDWGLVLADERRGFEVGTTVPVSLLIDARKPMRAIAKVIDAHGILIPLENANPVLDAPGPQHRRGAKFNLKMTGTRDAIVALAACVARHRGSERVELSTRAPV